ncbi:Bladder cancer-associated protein-like protein [Leptotrombidium deliense]|uniref:Bladder cancer-associated protein-like protein n=1 Tax=Leptotrombidium deliense TaxID=299467 RepID=A0A443SUG1_9ACAR|nr:Bladder cancer-associated protein-like protein [Leptotrombidium deliense]
MYCLQWLIPVLIIPKPTNPTLLQNHIMLVTLYLIAYCLERKPCSICVIVFFFALSLLCFSGYGNCLLNFLTACDAVKCT